MADGKAGRPRELHLRVSREVGMRLDEMGKPSNSSADVIAGILLGIAIDKYRVTIEAIEQKTPDTE